MASESSTPKAETRRASKAAPDAAVSPEGVPYQSSGWPESEENPGPFDGGEGKNSPLLKANVEAAKEQEEA